MSEPDPAYTDERFVRLYDAENPWHPMDDFYLGLDLAAGAVLDVGCGTGTRLARARAAGHTGRLVGVDPAPAMLAVARAKGPRVTWVTGDARTLSLGERFDLVTMTGHAFQLLLDDDGVLAALRAFRRHLVPGGLLAFETRNPAARPWERWTPDLTRDVVATADGDRYEVWTDAPRPCGSDLVAFDAVQRDLASGEVLRRTDTLRFVAPRHLRRLLAEEGFAVDGWFGDWDRSPVTPASPEVIVLARPRHGAGC